MTVAAGEEEVVVPVCAFLAFTFALSTSTPPSLSHCPRLAGAFIIAFLFAPLPCHFNFFATPSLSLRRHSRLQLRLHLHLAVNLALTYALTFTSPSLSSSPSPSPSIRRHFRLHLPPSSLYRHSRPCFCFTVALASYASPSPAFSLLLLPPQRPPLHSLLITSTDASSTTEDAITQRQRSISVLPAGFYRSLPSSCWLRLRKMSTVSLTPLPWTRMSFPTSLPCKGCSLELTTALVWDVPVPRVLRRASIGGRAGGQA